MGGVVLECAQFGDFDSFDVIKSNISMATTPDHLLPTPIATGLKTMYYMDNSVVEGGIYYYKFRVWRGLESLVSDDVRVLASQHTTYFTLNGTLEDFKGGAPLSLISGNIMYSDNGLFLDGATYLRRTGSEAEHFGTGDLVVECEFKSDYIGTSSKDQVLINCYSQHVYPSWQLSVGTNGRPYIWVYLYSNDVTLITSPISILDGNNHKLRWVRVNGISNLFVDDVRVASVADSYNYASPQYFDLGAQTYRPSGNAYYTKGLLRKVGVSKQV